MEARKYICNDCREPFVVRGFSQAAELYCPRCYATDIQEDNACSLEIGPPPWEYLCRVCGGRFNVKSPSGPDEAKKIKCPKCQSPRPVWLMAVSEACPTGG